MSIALARDRAVPSIASDVNSTSSFVQSASQRSTALTASQQTDSEPFSALLDAAAAAQQQSGAQANPPPPPQQPAISSPPQSSNFQSSSFQSNSSPKSSTATKDSSNPPAETSPAENSQPAPKANATAPTASPRNSKAPTQGRTTTNTQSAAECTVATGPGKFEQRRSGRRPRPRAGLGTGSGRAGQAIARRQERRRRCRRRRDDDRTGISGCRHPASPAAACSANHHQHAAGYRCSGSGNDQCAHVYRRRNRRSQQIADPHKRRPGS
jgi:hypothetical protein